MKLRRINPLELHAEKIFLAIIALVFVGVLTFQFVGQGNTVKVGDRADVPIDRAFIDLADRAAAQRARIRETDVDAQAVVEIPRVDEAFRTALGGSVVEAPELPIALGYPTGVESQVSAGSLEALAVELPAIPGPDRPVVRPFVGALDPLIVASNPQILEVAPTLAKEQPHDIRAVTVEAVFDASQYVAALNADPDGDGPLKPIPQVWWQPLDLMDVELLRREVYEDGSLGPEEIVPTPPGQFSLRDRLASAPDPREVRRTLSEIARERGQELLRPPFYPLIAGEAWIPPSVARAESGDAGLEAARLKRRIDQVKAEIDRLKKQLDSGDRRTLAPSSRSPVYAGPGGPGGPGRSAPGRDRREPRPSNRDDARETIQKRIDELQEQLKTLQAELDAATRQAPAGGGASPDLLNEPVRRPSAGEKITVWAHDITGRSGATYQYAVRLVLPNPLYGYDQAIEEPRRSAASSAVIRTQMSPWTSGVTVPNEAFFFVTQAREIPGLLGGSARRTATGEVFRLFYGFWRSAVVELTPGDSASATTRLLGQWPVFTVAADTNGSQVTGRTPLPADQLLDAGGWILVDVTPLAEGEGFQAVLADPAGQLVLRDPQADRASELRAALARNAEAGKNATVGEPGVAGTGTNGGKPVAPSPDREPPRDSQPGGPGGQPIDRPLGG